MRMRDTRTDMSALTEIQESLSTRGPVAVAQEAFTHANSNAGHNVFLSMDKDRTLGEAESLEGRFPKSTQRPLLYGVPVAIKDCFDVAGYPTTAGSRFYAEKNGIAQADSFVAARLRAAGSVMMGKTHLHQIAYGITGENPDYGDCVQPRDARVFTGGSSSGSAASVQEGSAVAAIGTDTGGSIRVPAALCGLAGYRSTLGLGGAKTWDGGLHLAPSFDTIGWLFRDLHDGPVLADALLGVAQVPAPQSVTVGVVGDSFVEDCAPAVLEVYRDQQEQLRRAGAILNVFEPDFWADTRDIFAPIQAHEAAAIHHGNFNHLEPSIAERLAWGEARTASEIESSRRRHDAFCDRMRLLFMQYDFLIMPCAPISALEVGVDHSVTRPRILRYTTPGSLAGVPVVALTAPGGGVQLMGARGDDARLLAFAAKLDRNP
jgi:Asp-tRNA(Asn)/Glu-tRNA(Gln) amidotransferase A subunit family amidase